MSKHEYGHLHNWGHTDYDDAKRQIWQMLGDISEFRLFGRQVLLAAYVRPSKSEVPGKSAWYHTKAEQKEDWWQGKAALVVKTGPSAFDGDKDYISAQYGDEGAPKIGDWVFLAAGSGQDFSIKGEGAARCKGTDHRGDEIDLYDWDGWPCRVVLDDTIIGAMTRPASIV